MMQNDDWFNETPGSDIADKILQYVRNTPLCYSAELSDKLDLDYRTIRRWLKYLLKKGLIEVVNMTVPPTPEQSKRIDELRANGMKKNHFKNATWYGITEKGNERN